MESSVKITLIIVAAVLAVSLIGSIVYLQSKPGNTVSTNGVSEVKALPDLVSLYFTIETSGKDAVEAKDKNAETSDAVVTSLIKQGLERKDITTESYNIYPEYDWINNKQELKAYKATNRLKVQISSAQYKKVGPILDAGVNAGALVSYINFELSLEKQNQYKAQALEQATQDARIKAEGIARGLNKKLGSLVSVSDSSFDYSPWPIYTNSMAVEGASEAKAAATSIQPGEETISGRVSVVYKII